MRGVVTGAAGFLASHVADVLAEAGHEITVVDLVENPRHRSVRASIGDRDDLVRAFAGAEFVCHLAAVGDVYLAAEKPWLAADVNVTGSANVCEAALKAGVSKIVYASTWEVYGLPQYQPVDEAHPCSPDHPYNITKLAGERLMLAYGHLREQLSVSALRLGTAYGKRMRPNSVFSVFIGRALRGETITIQGSGEQGRQFTHALDIGRAFAAALKQGANGESYNIVADRMVSIRELAELVTRFAPTEVKYGAPRPGDVPSAVVSNAKAQAELGWRAEVDFSQGLEELVAEARGQ